MKYSLLGLILIPLLFAGCSNSDSDALTEERVREIAEEVTEDTLRELVEEVIADNEGNTVDDIINKLENHEPEIEEPANTPEIDNTQYSVYDAWLEYKAYADAGVNLTSDAILNPYFNKEIEVEGIIQRYSTELISMWFEDDMDDGGVEFRSTNLPFIEAEVGQRVRIKSVIQEFSHDILRLRYARILEIYEEE